MLQKGRILNMNEVIWIAAAGILLGLALAFYLVADQIKDSNDMGNTKGGRLDYIVRFDLLSAKDNVPRSFDIDEM